MKKVRRLTAYLLVFTLITGLFLGIGYVSSPETEVSATSDFRILEIVPDESMATFFYFIDVEKYGITNYPRIGGKTIAENAAAGTVRDFLVNHLCGTIDASNHYVSSDYFYNKVLVPAGKTDVRIRYNAATPKDSDIESLISQADFIIINESVPSSLRISGVRMRKFGANVVGGETVNIQFTEDQVLKIFKKIAGIGGQNPVPYIIDYSLMNGSGLFDIRQYEDAFKDTSGGH